MNLPHRGVGHKRGNTAERIIIFDKEYLLYKNYMTLKENRTFACESV
jgi:hypothetical protein